MARMSKAKSGRDHDAGARPGAARVLPMRLMSHMPVIGRFARSRLPPPPPARKPGLLSPRRLVALLRREKPAPPPSRLRIPFVSPVVRGMRHPIERTAAVVRAARNVRKPLTRWERLREAARAAIDDPVDGTRWERLMGLGVGLVAGGRPAVAARPEPKGRRIPRVRTPRPRVEGVVPEPGLRARLRRLQAVLNENAGPGRSRDRRGIDASPKPR